MIFNENSKQILDEAFSSFEFQRVLDAAKIGVGSDNLVIVSTFMQNVLNQLFLNVSKAIKLEDTDIKENNQKTESIKKYLEGNDKRFSVGLDLICNYVIKNKRMWFNIQGLSINENANTVKFFESKDLEFVPTNDIVKTYNELLDALNKAFNIDSFDIIKL